jgi:SAM-dependent methyltransferase
MSRNRLIVIAAVIGSLAGLGGYFLGSSHRSDDAAEARRRKREKEEAEAEVHTCNICGEEAKFKKFAGRKNATCPKCKSKERHRLLMHWIANASPLAKGDKLDVLHFSPEDAEEEFMRTKLPHLHYVTADYLHDEELRLDLTQLELPDESWDALIVYHILEHIEADQKAMNEMFRVLRPGGMAILQVPIDTDRKDIYEDPTITDDKGRAKAFGQKDHVRRYSSSGLKQRLEAAGFRVQPIDYIKQLGPEIVEKHQLAGEWKKKQDERIWVAHKPKPGAAAVPTGATAGGAAADGKAAVAGDAAADGKAAVAGDAAADGKAAAEPVTGGVVAEGKASNAVAEK